MKRLALRAVPVVALLVAGIAAVTPRAVRTEHRSAEHQERRVADVHR